MKEITLIKQLEKLSNKIDEIKQPKSWMTVDEISKYLNISTSKTRQLVSNDEIPYSRTNPLDKKSKLLFNRKLVDSWLLTGNTKPTKRDIEKIKQFI